jgi:hypothetical protein
VVVVVQLLVLVAQEFQAVVEVEEIHQQVMVALVDLVA